MTKDLAIALVCLFGFVFFLARAERSFQYRQHRYEWMEGATATDVSTWSYTTSRIRYVNPHGFAQRWHNLATDLGLRDGHTYYR